RHGVALDALESLGGRLRLPITGKLQEDRGDVDPFGIPATDVHDEGPTSDDFGIVTQGLLELKQGPEGTKLVADDALIFIHARHIEALEDEIDAITATPADTTRENLSALGSVMGASGIAAELLGTNPNPAWLAAGSVAF